MNEVVNAPVQCLLSLPPAMAGFFSQWSAKPVGDWFASCDPAGCKLGSGGGVAQLIVDAWKANQDGMEFATWLRAQKRLVILAGGQSRRLPAYAATGKVLMPVPVLPNSFGQRLDQTLLDLQVSDYQEVLLRAPEFGRILVASGDVFLKFPKKLPPVPDADIVGFGMSVSPEVAAGFGVFFCHRESDQEIALFLQKPTPDRVRDLAREYSYFVDTGLWLLSERAVEVLMKKCGWNGNAFTRRNADYYELYSGMGPAIGTSPLEDDPDVRALTSAVVPLRGAAFYHFGTTRQMIESLSSLRSRGTDDGGERDGWRKPHPDMYVINSDFAFDRRTSSHRMLWIENCSLPGSFLPTHENALTGFHRGDWALDLPPGLCVDFVPIGETSFAVRPYGFDDSFSGELSSTNWMGRPGAAWFQSRGLVCPGGDIQEAPLFAVVDEVTNDWLQWLTSENPEPSPNLAARWGAARRLCARELAEEINLARLFAQRGEMATRAAELLWEHRETNPFFRIDLEHAAGLFAASKSELPVPVSTSALDRTHEAAFAAAVLRARGGDGAEFERRAFESLAERIVSLSAKHGVAPRSALIDDQILWARSPVRLDLAGGWSDTPPFCLKHGGAVVNLGVELNGQAPVQVFVRSCAQREIVIRSIDLGAETRIRSAGELADCANVGSEFSLAKAAFCLAGFHPRFRSDGATTLADMLEAFGGGLEVSMLAATPKGSGLGTSSVLAATLLGALGSAGGLGWDRSDVLQRTLSLEQMLTSGGGWQDQAGAILHGLKLVETTPGFDQIPSIKWLPEHLFGPANANRTALLYYTGITRVAKGILREIVRGMFLNSSQRMRALFAIRAHAQTAYEAIQRESWDDVCEVVRHSWELNQALDPGTNPPEIAALLRQIDDWSAGAKLLGAGGGGYLLIMAKDPDAASRIRASLIENPPNPRARFVDFSLSSTGLQITRS